jgi:hypothetical protein
MMCCFYTVYNGRVDGNENSDPDVQRNTMPGLVKRIPDRDYIHFEL